MYLVNPFPSQKNYILKVWTNYLPMFTLFFQEDCPKLLHRNHSDNLRWCDLNRLNRNPNYFRNLQSKKVRWWQKKLLFRVAYSTDAIILQYYNYLFGRTYTIETKSARQVRKQYLSNLISTRGADYAPEILAHQF